MRSHRRRAPLEHVLVAADVAELDAIRSLLALLPETAYGQVYVEVADHDELPAIPAPPRVTVNPVRREQQQPIGEQLSAAVAGWVGEWIPEEPPTDRAVSMWLGSTVAATHEPVIDARLERL